MAHALTLAREFVNDCYEVSFSVKGSIGIFTSIGNFDGVQCPICGAEVEDWWLEAVGRAYENGFLSLDATVPCCSATVSLNEMHYSSGFPSGFARFAIELRNPNESRIAPDHLRILEDQLGCPLKIIHAHL